MSGDELSARFRETYNSPQDGDWEWGEAPPEEGEPPAAEEHVAEGEVVQSLHGWVEEEYLAEGDDSTWLPVDLEPILTGEGELEPPPAMLERTDGERLLYESKTHIVFGEPESAKGWLVCLATRERILAGEHVLYIDFDDQDAGVIVSRLRTVGLSDDEIREQFHYVAPDEPFDDDSSEKVERILDEYEPTLAVLDGFTDALTLHDIQIADNTEIAKWMRGLPRMLRMRGVAVVLIDHVVKDKEKRGGYSLGGQHKRAKVDVSYELTVKEAWGRGLTGRTVIKEWKDRPGHVKRLGRHRVIAELIGESVGDGKLSMRLEPPQEKPDHKRLTGFMERLSKALEAAPDGLNINATRANVDGNNGYIDSARLDLVNEGYASEKRRGQEKVIHSVRPYREADDPEAT